LGDFGIRMTENLYIVIGEGESSAVSFVYVSGCRIKSGMTDAN
jgi:hypothetical protein